MPDVTEPSCEASLASRVYGVFSCVMSTVVALPRSVASGIMGAVCVVSGGTWGFVRNHILFHTPYIGDWIEAANKRAVAAAAVSQAAHKLSEAEKAYDQALEALDDVFNEWDTLSDVLAQGLLADYARQEAIRAETRPSFFPRLPIVDDNTLSIVATPEVVERIKRYDAKKSAAEPLDENLNKARKEKDEALKELENARHQLSLLERGA